MPRIYGNHLKSKKKVALKREWYVDSKKKYQKLFLIKLYCKHINVYEQCFTYIIVIWKTSVSETDDTERGCK